MFLYQLLEGCKQHDPKAQFAFMAFYRPKMLRYCQRYIINTGAAEEVMMDGFINCLAKIHKFTYFSDAQTEAWVLRIMSNAMNKYYRKEKNLLEFSAEYPTNVKGGDDVISSLSMKELLAYLDRTPPKGREIFIMHCMLDMTHEEIAAKLKIKVGTSCSQVKRTRGLLKKMITNNYYDYVYRKAR